MGLNPLKYIKKLLKSRNLLVQIMTAIFIFWLLKQLFRINNIEGMEVKNRLKYFFMKGCPHCDKFNPIWEEFIRSDKAKTINHSKVSAEEMNEKEKKMVSGFPTVVLTDGAGNLKKTFKDERTVSALKKFIS